MESLKPKLFAIGIGLLIAYTAFIFIYSRFFTGSSTMSSLGFYLVIGFAVLLVISGFLPYNWGKVLREISYLLLFASILVAELIAIKPMVQRTNISIGNCEKVFVPSSSSSSSLYNALSYASCVMTGYYPKESPTTANVAWVSFYIFYLILPFTFIWVLMYGLMNSMGMDKWFSGVKHINRLLSFIIALFAMRVFIGEALLEFLGYGAWGLAGVFIAIFLVSGLRHMIEKWYGIEKQFEETKNVIEKQYQMEKYAAQTLLKRLKDIRSYGNQLNTKRNALLELITPGTPYFQNAVQYLSDALRNSFIMAIKSNINDPDKALDEAEKVLAGIK